MLARIASVQPDSQAELPDVQEHGSVREEQLQPQQQTKRRKGHGRCYYCPSPDFILERLAAVENGQVTNVDDTVSRSLADLKVSCGVCGWQPGQAANMVTGNNATATTGDNVATVQVSGELGARDTYSCAIVAEPSVTSPGLTCNAEVCQPQRKRPRFTTKLDVEPSARSTAAASHKLVGGRLDGGVARHSRIRPPSVGPSRRANDGER